MLRFSDKGDCTVGDRTPALEMVRACVDGDTIMPRVSRLMGENATEVVLACCGAESRRRGSVGDDIDNASRSFGEEVPAVPMRGLLAAATARRAGPGDC